MSFGRAVFGFLREPVRHDIGSNHYAAGLCLKIACWVNFVFILLAAVIGLIVGLLVLVSAAFWDTIRQNIEGPQWIIDLGPAAAVLGAGVVLFATVIVVLLLTLYLWWKNHTYQLWNQVAPNAQVWANVLGAVMLALSLGSMSGGGDLVSIALAVLILVFANVAASKGELDTGAQAQQTPTVTLGKDEPGIGTQAQDAPGEGRP